MRRSDLYTRSQSASPTPSEPDPELEAQFRARLASIYGSPSNLTPVPLSTALNVPADINDGDAASEGQAEQEFEFRLFSTTGTAKPGNEEDETPQKILLVDEDEDVGDGGFVVQERNRGYYFAEKAQGEKQIGFEIMALSGEDVLSRAKRRAWGLEVPWRVRVLKVIGKKGIGEAFEVAGTEDMEGDMKRKRPGKKRRIILRERKKLRKKLQEQKKVEQEKKEEAEREKRTRRNREKKVKRKMKEKAKKAGDTVEDASDNIMEGGEPLAVGTGDEKTSE